MKSLTIVLITLLFLLITDYVSEAQAVYATYTDGKWKYVNSSSYMMDQSVNLSTAGTSSSLLIGSSKFKLLFSKDSADAFNPGLYAYATVAGFASMDVGNGQKAIIMSVLDTAIGRITTSYYSPTSFQPVITVVDTGYKDIVVGTQALNLPITSTSSMQNVLYYGNSSGGSVPPLGTTNTQVRSGFSGQTLFRGLVNNNISSYYYARGFLDESKTSFDLTGNGLYEIIGVGNYTDSFGGGFKLYVYDNLALIDSIRDGRAGISGGVFTTVNDLNSDGRPEIVVSVDNAPNFYQWNPATQKFKLLASLSNVQTMLASPENVDADSSKEIIAQTGTIGDSLIIYSSTFVQKAKIKIPGLGITRYFVEKLKTTPNKQIIVVGNGVSNYGQSQGTFVYDLSLGQTPIWGDSSFEALAVGDFRKVGHSEILGYRLTGPFGLQRGVVSLIDPTNSYKPAWTLSDSTLSYTTLAGPFQPASDAVFARITSYKGLPRLASVDFNGDGINDFVMKTVDKSYKTLYIILSANGTVLDSLPGVPATSTALAYDFNGNGRSELVMTYVPNSFLLPGDLKIRKSWVFEYTAGTSVDRSNGIPGSFTLEQNFPNPFNPSTSIKYLVGKSGNIKVVVYDLMGRTVRTLVDGVQSSGWHMVVWDGTNENRKAVSTGAYFYRIENNGQVESKKMLMLK